MTSLLADDAQDQPITDRDAAAVEPPRRGRHRAPSFWDKFWGRVPEPAAAHQHVSNR